jgi:hypothetical protein
MFHYRFNPRLSRSSALRRNRAGPSTPASSDTGRGELLDIGDPWFSLGRLLKAWILLTTNSITFTVCLAAAFGLALVRLLRFVGRPLHLFVVVALWSVFRELFSAHAATAAGCVGDIAVVCFGPPDNTTAFNVTETLRVVGDWLPDMDFILANLPNLQVKFTSVF